MPLNKMELWGGIECTINRVGDTYMDQLDHSGHYQRPEDLDSFADLKISKLRYPVLWEKHQPDESKKIDWSYTERNLLYLRKTGMEPIAGLVHHGSGPGYVYMADETFAEGLAAYAGEVASRFPWINYYTPVNEPLTTARFCGLYGHWHPHLKGDKSFVRILVNECKATVLSMQSIRKVNPDAKLVQTEDLGKIHSTPLLQYQADFENNRRWLSIDLLCGKVNKEHPLWNYVLTSGITEEELGYFIQNPCPPDILGFNHYITSERFLDERLEYYPPHTHGGNHTHRYADVEAVRVSSAEMSGPYNLLKEAWQRYGLPLAVTEVHLHCTREEQLRWFHTVWNAALKLQKEGADVRGVTAWAMLGSFGWNKLLTSPDGDYEPGIFDILSGKLRSTALCKMIKALASGEHFSHPVLDGDGWWEKDYRIIYNHDQPFNNIKSLKRHRAPVLITGRTGTLGSAFARICAIRDIDYKLLSRAEFDITNPLRMEKVIREIKPWAIINTAGFVRVDDAETDEINCFLSNAAGPLNIARLCKKYNIKFLTFSSDLVFDGNKNDFYTENDRANPLNIYGKSKVKAEEDVLQTLEDALVVRTSAFFGPWDQYNFVSGVCNSLKAGEAFPAVNDIYISPTYVPDLANISLDLLIDDESGIWHLANRGSLSWYDLALQVAGRLKCNPANVVAIKSNEMPYKAARPGFSAMKSERGFLLPSLENALDRYFSEHLISA